MNEATVIELSLNKSEEDNLLLKLAVGSLLLMLTVLTLIGAVPTQNNAAEEIKAVNQQLSEAVAAGNLDAIGMLYTADAIYMPPNANPNEGRDAIMEGFAAEIAAGMGAIRLTADEIEVLGDTAHEIGRYVVETADGGHLDHGKYIVIWKNTQDGWKLSRDIFNSNMAPR